MTFNHVKKKLRCGHKVVRENMHLVRFICLVLRECRCFFGLQNVFFCLLGWWTLSTACSRLDQCWQCHQRTILDGWHGFQLDIWVTTFFMMSFFIYCRALLYHWTIVWKRLGTNKPYLAIPAEFCAPWNRDNTTLCENPRPPNFRCSNKTCITARKTCRGSTTYSEILLLGGETVSKWPKEKRYYRWLPPYTVSAASGRD